MKYLRLPGFWVLRLALCRSDFLILALAFNLISCASSVKVKTNTEALTRESVRSANLLAGLGVAMSPALSTFGSSSAMLLNQAQGLEKRGQKKDAAAHYLKVSADAHVLLTSGSEKPATAAEKALIEIHNSALARFIELWAHDPRRLEPGPYHLSSDGQAFEIDLSKASYYQKGYFDRYIPAEAIQEDGMVRNVRDGLGAPAVGIRDQLPGRESDMKYYPKRGLHTPVTVTMDSVKQSPTGDGVTQVEFSLRNPMIEDTVALSGRTLPLAADYTAPIAIIMNGRNEAAFGLKGFFEADARLAVAGIYLMEPYDPKRTPVLLVHGLVSSPYMWRDILSDMMADPEISKRYQFMVFGYPSSFPLAESAALLRDNLAALRAKYDPDGNDPLSKDMVVAGHSMGGMLTHTLVADMGDNLWKQFSDKPLDEIAMDQAAKERIRKLVFFEPDPAINRVVYFSAPHRGATMAEKNLVGAVSKLAKLPSTVVQDPSELTGAAGGADLKIPLGKTYTSRESLEPGAPMVVAMDTSPYKTGVIYHSIIGDRGKGDSPNSSDGIVEYWSSHQEGAASELIVPTGHDSYNSPLAVEEFRRILREHVGVM